MFAGLAGVCGEAERGADKHVRLIQLTILLLSKGAAAEIHASLNPEHRNKPASVVGEDKKCIAANQPCRQVVTSREISHFYTRFNALDVTFCRK